MTPVPHVLTSPSLLINPRNSTGPAALWARMEEAAHPDGITENRTPGAGTLGSPAAPGPDADEQRWDSEGGFLHTSARGVA